MRAGPVGEVQFLWSFSPEDLLRAQTLLLAVTLSSSVFNSLPVACCALHGCIHILNYCHWSKADAPASLVVNPETVPQLCGPTLLLLAVTPPIIFKVPHVSLAVLCTRCIQVAMPNCEPSSFAATTPCAAISRGAQPSSSPVDPTSSESTAHNARNGQMAVTEMGKALSSPAELLHDNVLSIGEVTTVAARPAAAADAAILAELAGTATAAILGDTGGTLSFGANLMTTDPCLKLPSLPSVRKSNPERVGLTECGASKREYGLNEMDWNSTQSA
eukprot:1155740-Pelagomonas_calceolata.AAC.5